MYYKDYPVNIEKKLVLKYLGYKNDKVPEEIMDKIDKAIDDAYKFIKPKIVYDRYNVFYDEKDNKLILPNGDDFSEDYIVNHLKNAEYLVFAVITLGSSIEEKISQYFSSGDIMKGMIYDAISNSALDYLSRSLWKDLAGEAESQGKGITQSFCPGDSRWNIKDQEKIFNLLDAKSIGVSLNDDFMMKPLKSLSIVYGAGKNIKTSLADHDCSQCDLKNCSLRHTSKKFFKVNVSFGKVKKIITAEMGENLFELLIKNGIEVYNLCGGHHKCGKCKVKVDTEQFISEEEEKFLSDDDKKENMRLSCFITVDKNLNVVVPYNDKTAVILTDDNELPVISFRPRIGKKHLNLDKPSLNDQRDDHKRILDAIGINATISADLLKKLPDIIEKTNYNIACTVRGDEIVSVGDINDKEELYGIAIDIGTTTIALFLYNISTGKKVDVYSALNHEKVFGADVISRINYTIMKEDGLDKINKIIIDEINDLIDDVCKKNKIHRNSIYEITAVGNTTMIHFLLNVSCKNIANSPFIPVFTSKMQFKAHDLGININPEGYIVTLPMAASYIGSDTVAAILSSRMYLEEEINLLLDIGTNSEIVLGNKDRLFACSAAAGPAFEGAGITCGMGGIAGAIEHVDFTNIHQYKTIGNVEPQGLCGSGIVDLIAGFVKYGIVDMTGRLLSNEEVSEYTDKGIADRIIEYKGERVFLLDKKNDIYVTQKDIRQVQLAKGAILAGIRILMREMGIKTEDIANVYFAGGFGKYINVESAAEIGLIPYELKDKVVQIGNAAGKGAILALLSDEELSTASKIKDSIKYIELSSITSFQEEFMEGMYFKRCNF
jgi:uncharacterized 2Fe-2S/4Fe-4S cluster protein (DUF4445 family)